MAMIVRPVKGRVLVRLPYRPRGQNYQLLKSICGDLTRPTYNQSAGGFEVARTHLGVLIDRLASEIGQRVQVVLYGSSQIRCVEACWNANPDTKWECVCSCAGMFHGTRTGPSKHLGGGLAVETEYTTQTYFIDP